MATCAIKWCGKSKRSSNFHRDGITFHRFPKCADRKKKWIDATHRGEKWFYTKNSVICSRHFEADTFKETNGRRWLMDSAMPTLYLPILSNAPSTSGITHQKQQPELTKTSSPELDKVSTQSNETSIMNWGREETCQFIELYKNMPVLWNPKHYDYKEKSIKKHSLDRLAALCNTTTEEVRRKIHNLRCQYNLQLRKLRKLAAYQGVDESELTSDWRYFKNFSFLRPICVGLEKLQEKQNTSNFKIQFHSGSESSDVDESISFESTNDEPEVVEQEYITNEKNVLLTESNCTEPLTIPKRQTFKSESIYFVDTGEDSQVSNEFIIDKQTNVETKSKDASASKHGHKRSNPANSEVGTSDDDHSIFGEFVASELRNLNNRSAKKLKHKILRAILDVGDEEIE